jgi:hypothetical protein
MLKLLEYDYSIEYKKRSDNTVADALSRKVDHHSSEECLAITTVIPKWMEEVITSYAADDACTKKLQELAIDPMSHPNYSLNLGLLRYKNRIVVGQNSALCTTLFDAFHSSPM